ncbi:hypothetical protein A6R68_08880 [Neotoma lepida]|uniref:Uncharacterized protein n=1 Tax=Neotoma lepida TaxID=56216 RepID=A0A1A6G2C5_NEOLE|nr:hypothetical protein A6R68_08880 [Neotoma lepida]
MRQHGGQPWDDREPSMRSFGKGEKAVSIWESKDFFFELEPLPGAVEAVKQMANLQNTDVFICTSPIKMIKYCPYEKATPGPEALLSSPGAEPHPSWEHILFTSCHNHHLQLKPPRRRLHSWADDWKAILDSKRPH